MDINFLEKIVNKLDFIKEIFKSPSWNDDPPFYKFSTLMDVNFYKGDGNPPEPYSSGMSLNSEKALFKSVFEAIERFCLASYKESDLLLGTYNQLSKKGKVLEPAAFKFYSDSQLRSNNFKNFSYSSDESFKWTKCENLKNKEEVLLPAQLIYCPYKYENEKALMFPISTGAAAGLSLEECLYKGVCEIVERDSFILMYLFKINPTRLIFDKDELPGNLKKYFYLLNKFKIKIDIFEIKQESSLHSVFAIISDVHSTTPAISIGLKTDLDYEKAIIGAIDEAFQSRSWIRRCIILDNFSSDQYTDSLLLERAKFWSDTKNVNLLDFIFTSKKGKKLVFNDFSVSRVSYSDKLEQILSDFSNCNFFYKNLALPEVSELGIFVTKVISSSFHPLFLDENYPYLSGKRFIKFKKNHKTVNKVPHPFL